MKIIGISATSSENGTINTDYIFSYTINMGPSNIWAHPELQEVAVNDDDGVAYVYVSGFHVVGQNPVSGIRNSGRFINNCDQVTFGMYTNDCIARIHNIIYYLGT
jgi:hypothetical protein